MEAWGLPTCLEIGGKSYTINSDYRDVLAIIDQLSDPNNSERERWYVGMALFYTAFAQMPYCHYQESADKMADFIACGKREQNRKPRHPLLDWRQDAPLIAAGVNKVAGCEVRSLPFLHWWTFVGYFAAIGEGPLATVVGIRAKLQGHKPLDKWEQEYYREHRAEVDVRVRMSQAEQDARRELEQMLGL